MNANRFPPLALLAGSIVAALATASPGYAAIIVADGTFCTLSNAITAANTDLIVGGCRAGSGADAILISGDMTLSVELPAVISDIAFSGPFATSTAINGDGLHRLFFIGSDASAPAVSFSNLVLNGGKAQGGGSSKGAGAGAGLGGGLFIYDGNVSMNGVTFSNNLATGGAASGFTAQHSGNGGGGGMFGIGGTGASGGGSGYVGGAGGAGGFGGGGGGGGDTFSSEGGGNNSGGVGGGFFGGGGGNGSSIMAFAGGFGGGGGGGGANGGVFVSQPGASGGFGGGGGGGAGSGTNPPNIDVPGAAGAGGFGAGGGGGGSATSGTGGNGGMGGFGGGGGSVGFGLTAGAQGLGGFGGGDPFEGGGGGGGGFGGAIFIRSGQLDLVNTQFSGNSASRSAISSGSPLALGKGGAVFAMHVLTQENGDNLGMPTALPKVTGCINTFSSSTASDAGSTSRDNVDTFGADRLGLTLICNDRIFADGFGVP